jgi:hypothetical protein
MMTTTLNTLIEALPWAPILLGIGAALAILVIYDVAYVFPLCRRLAAVGERCRLLEQTFVDLPSLSAQVALLADRGRADLARIGERLGQIELATDERSYEQAITSAERGDDPDRLISCFGLTEGEAKLVTLLHGDRQRAPERRGNARG